jgi:Ran GTPase-activating protein (RanGAP) involved in mRNA processing and transport
MSGDDGAIAVGDIIKACSSLEDLRFSGTRSQKRGCLAAANAINSLTTLIKLDLADNMFKEDAGEILASALGKQINLIHLNLRDAGLGTDNTVLVLKAMKNSSYCSILKFLDLSGNDIDPDVAESLSSTLSIFQSLEELYLDDNEMGTDGITIISKNISKLPIPALE